MQQDGPVVAHTYGGGILGAIGFFADLGTGLAMTAVSFELRG
jgi:hypothetical protein